MDSRRLGVAHAIGLLCIFVSAQLAGCLSHQRDEGGDAGTDATSDGSRSGACGEGAECAPGNRCVCDRCISEDLPSPACDPSCATAAAGDLCTEEGRVCPRGLCFDLVCSSGTFVGRAAGDTCDAGPGADAGIAPDAGWCECPAPPPGCVYDGSPCGCSHLTCAPERCGREVCVEGTTCCNSTCGTCVPPGGACTDLACVPDCSPQDAHGGGACAGSPGWAWDGVACRELACACVGSECDAIYPTESECNAYFSACPAANCTPDDAAGVGGCAALLGYVFTSRGCFPISGCSCTGADCDAVLGQTEAQCNDAHASCPILFL